jgi:CheY-like chemotaxis protein
MAKRILLADDSVTIQKVVELTFMDEDYEVVAVSNGDDALARLADVQPDLVIADVHMPGANGYDLCRHVKQWRPATPVLLLVGTFEPFQEEEARRAAADGHLKKPFDSQELLRRVEELIAAAQAGGVASVTATPAEEMDSWHAPERGAETEAGDLFAEGTENEEPAGPLGQEIPGEMVLEASPWTEAEEGQGGGGWGTHKAPEPSAQEPPSPGSFATSLAPTIAPTIATPAKPSAPAPAHAPSAPASTNGGSLSDADVDRIARRVVELLGDQLVREVAWEVVPDMAELVIKDRLRELERQLEGP